MLHRIRLAMQTKSFLRLSGEVDETFIGGKARNMHHDARQRKITGRGPHASGKTPVVGMLERAQHPRRWTFRRQRALHS
jgi:hypothetical protein